jgi:preprotein translocase subunit YajC
MVRHRPAGEEATALDSILFSLLAQEQGGQGAPGAAGCQGMMSMLFPILLMFVIIFFLIIRPQQKQQRQHQEMLKALKKGDKVITASGIFGTIANLNDNVVTLEVAKNVHLRVLRAQVAGLQSGALEKAGEEAAAEGK